MRYVEIDVPDVRSAFLDHDDFIWRLHDLECTGEREHGRDAGGQAGRFRLECDLPAVDFGGVLLHHVLHPGLQVRVGEIADPISRSPSGGEAMARVLTDRDRRAGNSLDAAAARVDPASLASG